MWPFDLMWGWTSNDVVTLLPVTVVDRSGPRYGVVDQSAERYAVTDRSAPRYEVEG